MPGPILFTLFAGFAGAWFLFLAALAGRKNQLQKTYRAQTYYDLKMAEIEQLKAARMSDVEKID